MTLEPKWLLMHLCRHVHELVKNTLRNDLVLKPSPLIGNTYLGNIYETFVSYGKTAYKKVLLMCVHVIVTMCICKLSFEVPALNLQRYVHSNLHLC